jgi:hypothetical protein
MRLSSRSVPPLLSRLRRHASAHGGSVLPEGLSSRTRPWSSNRPHLCSCFGGNQIVQWPQHLYVATDDWKNGFSLHKLSLDDLLGGHASMEPQRLPEPALRLSFLMVGSRPRFHALGTNIVVTSHVDRGLTLVYDTETASLHTQQSLPPDLFGPYDAVPADAKLHTFNFKFNPCCNGGLHYLCQTESGTATYQSGGRSPHNDEEGGAPHSMRPQQRWTWKSGPPPPLSTSPEPYYVSGRALHPDGRTIFVSVKTGDGKELGTFSLDMESGAWTCHGDWCLPFKGLAHYDGDLDAWVGIRTVDHKEDYSCHPHLCSCDVPALAGNGCTPAPPPAWKVAEEKLTFIEAPLKSMYHRVLVPMRCTGGGAGGTFCLVELTLRPGVNSYRGSIGDSDRWVLRVTMFRAKYGKSGELVAVPLQPGRSYLMSRYLTNYQMSAFWI